MVLRRDGSSRINMATTRQPRQFLAVWNDAGTEVKGATFEESVYVEGAFWKNELTSVAPENFGEFGTMFSNQLQIQHDVLVVEKATLLVEKATLESEKASLTSQLASKTTEAEGLAEDKAALTAEKSELVASHAEEKSELILNHMAEKATLNAALAAANARIVHLTNELPFNPREISVHSFKARLFKVLETEDVVRMYAVDSDPILKQIASTIANWDSQYPIQLDSQELQQPLAYLVSIDLLTPNEVTFLRQDCVRSEAYFPPEEE